MLKIHFKSLTQAPEALFWFSKGKNPKLLSSQCVYRPSSCPLCFPIYYKPLQLKSIVGRFLEVQKYKIINESHLLL